LSSTHLLHARRVQQTSVNRAESESVCVPQRLVVLQEGLIPIERALWTKGGKEGGREGGREGKV
jgi:hypothetical protein